MFKWYHAIKTRPFRRDEYRRDGNGREQNKRDHIRNKQ